MSSARTSSTSSGSGTRNDSSRRSGGGRNNRPSRSSEAGPYSDQAIQQLPGLPWDRREQTEIVAHFAHFSTRFFRGKAGHPEEERSRPAGFLLSYILTRFQGPHLPSAMERMAVLEADLPQLTPGTVRLFRQTAQVAASQGDRNTWLTATVRAIEYGTAEYVHAYIQGTPAKSLISRARAIQRDLQAAITVLEVTDSKRRLAICYDCDLAIKVTQGDYSQVPELLRQCINLLGQAFGMDDIAKQLMSGIVTEEQWTASTPAAQQHLVTAHSST